MLKLSKTNPKSIDTTCIPAKA